MEKAARQVREEERLAYRAAAGADERQVGSKDFGVEYPRFLVSCQPGQTRLSHFRDTDQSLFAASFH